MVEKLKNVPAQRNDPRSFKESENMLLQKITLAMAQLKNVRKELKRLEVMHKTDKGSVNASGDNTNKRIFELDDMLEPTFQNPDIARKRYGVLKLADEILELNHQLRKLRSVF
ncbi:hypothetical protein A3C86_02230 [Candidatus Kaiserbacteria bacterium RIFCSPHIGHO2_02_FULL_49_16]|uniref:DAD domain-containing protein n=2 Tax=Parcubacteria group TaxID=1794811 RepID=A0A0G1ZE06_9BACT|nr:MAG: hypothetical protein UY58_C0003G0011 [Candidatus Magasanikbacteria bacterium GW2011_GWA2_50_22]OGG58762.1 MAG: hypothetical protein A3C86_02230 [Candidatus Kaiserbacteria bacterium RIFCSPHIGHO2_02_FULL_49_16]